MTEENPIDPNENPAESGLSQLLEDSAVAKNIQRIVSEPPEPTNIEVPTISREIANAYQSMVNIISESNSFQKAILNQMENDKNIDTNLAEKIRGDKTTMNSLGKAFITQKGLFEITLKGKDGSLHKVSHETIGRSSGDIDAICFRKIEDGNLEKIQTRYSSQDKNEAPYSCSIFIRKANEGIEGLGVSTQHNENSLREASYGLRNLKQTNEDLRTLTISWNALLEHQGFVFPEVSAPHFN